MEFTCEPKAFMFFWATGNRKVNHQKIIATSLDLMTPFQTYLKIAVVYLAMSNNKLIN